MFGNECLGELKYEATTTAIVVAGAFLTFLLQYSSLRLSDSRAGNVASKSGIQHAESMNGDASDKSSQVQVPTIGHDHRMPKLDDPLSVLILEMGIIFHSASVSKPIYSASGVLADRCASHWGDPRSCRRFLLQDPCGGNHLPPDVRRACSRGAHLAPEHN